MALKVKCFWTWLQFSWKSYFLFPSLLNNVFKIILKKLNTQYLRVRPHPSSWGSLPRVQSRWVYPCLAHNAARNKCRQAEKIHSIKNCKLILNIYVNEIYFTPAFILNKLLQIHFLDIWSLLLTWSVWST